MCKEHFVKVKNPGTISITLDQARTTVIYAGTHVCQKLYTSYSIAEKSEANTIFHLQKSFTAEPPLGGHYFGRSPSFTATFLCEIRWSLKGGSITQYFQLSFSELNSIESVEDYFY